MHGQDTDGVRRRAPERLYDEDIAVRWAALLCECARTHGAPHFAWHMADRGPQPAAVRDMAANWRREEFEPGAFADTLEAFAASVEGAGAVER